MSFKPWGTEGAKAAIQEFYTQLRNYLAKSDFKKIHDHYPDDTVIFTGKAGKCHKGKNGASAFWSERVEAGMRIRSIKIQIVDVKEVETIVRVGEFFKPHIERVFYLGQITHLRPTAVKWFSGIADHGEQCCIEGIYETHNF